MYAAGPVALLAAVAQAAACTPRVRPTRAVAAPTRRPPVALERPLTCATGLCHGCPVPVTGDDGTEHVVRACYDGPVFRGDRVRWESLA